jgi:hypothetical protein
MQLLDLDQLLAGPDSSSAPGHISRMQGDRTAPGCSLAIRAISVPEACFQSKAHAGLVDAAAEGISVAAGSLVIMGRISVAGCLFQIGSVIRVTGCHDMPLRDDLFGFVTLSRHRSDPPRCHKTYFRVDEFNGGGSQFPLAAI